MHKHIADSLVFRVSCLYIRTLIFLVVKYINNSCNTLYIYKYTSLLLRMHNTLIHI